MFLACRKVAALLGVLSLTACQTQSGFVPGGEVNAWLKSGVSRAKMQQDGLQCTINAAKDIPQSIQTKYIGGMYSPGQVYCNSMGNGTYCNTYGGMNIPAMMRSYDANDGLRNQAVALCLTKKGYTLQTARYCESPNDYTTEGCVNWR
jgi:hypothetical protein